MGNIQEERRALIIQACKKLLDEVEGTTKDFMEMGQPLASDGFDTIHTRLLFLTSVERDLSYLYRQVRDLRRQTEISLSQAKSDLADAKMEAAERPTFNSITSFDSRPIVEARLRSLSIEHEYNVVSWENTLRDVLYAQDVVYSFQQDAQKERRDIDTRLKILGMQY